MRLIINNLIVCLPIFLLTPVIFAQEKCAEIFPTETRLPSQDKAFHAVIASMLIHKYDTFEQHRLEIVSGWIQRYRNNPDLVLTVLNVYLDIKHSQEAYLIKPRDYMRAMWIARNIQRNTVDPHDLVRVSDLIYEFLLHNMPDQSEALH